MKSSNKNLVEFEKQAALAATGSDKPYAAMIKYAGLAAVDGAFTADGRDKFYAKLAAAKPAAIKTHKTLIDNRRSEAWSCVKLAFEFKHCAADLFANLEKATPTPTGIYDIACAIRHKAQFADGKECAKKAITLHATSAVAPTVEAMQAAIKASNTYRNDLAGGSAARPLDKVLESMVKTLTAFQNGKRDPKSGKPAKNAKGESITLPTIANKTLGEAIASLNAFKVELTSTGNGKVVPMRKRA
jgi:hypothetical protein